jgi:hypothetical protein
VDTAIPNDRSAFSIASAAKRRASAAVIRHVNDLFISGV